MLLDTLSEVIGLGDYPLPYEIFGLFFFIVLLILFFDLLNNIIYVFVRKR